MNNPFDRDAQPPPTLSVSQLNRQVKSLLESHYDFIWVEGEISNFSAPASGHWYFSLKDGDAQVRCAMFKGRNQRLRFKPGNGDAVRLRARVSLYEARGEFQLIGEHMEAAGAGALHARFEALKDKLRNEGLFNPALKQPLPEVVRHVGVVTSASGAALHDILTVLARRCPSIKVSVLPVAVQGEDAAPQIAQAIQQANRWQASGAIDLDLLIVGRGGGSLEDLWAFNEETVARAIVASKLPIVSAVGHEVDFSISDMVADARAPTPSAAAELVSPDQREWLATVFAGYQALIRAMRSRLRRDATRLEHLRARVRHPGARLREQSQRLDDMEQRLLQAQHALLQRKMSAIALLQSRLRGASPGPRIERRRSALERLELRMAGAMRGRIGSSHTRLAKLAAALDSLSPLATLGRGYALVTDAQGSIIFDAAAVAAGETVRARLARGELELEVKRVLKASE